MKFKSIKADDAVSALAKAGGATVGLMIPNGAANVIAKVSDESIMTDAQKNTKLYVNVAAFGLGLLGVLAVDGKDLTTDIVQSVSLGVAAGGAKGVVQHFLKDKVTAMTDGTAKQFLAGGLGCPCQTGTAPTTTYLARPRSLRRPALNMPSLRGNVPSFRTESNAYANVSLNV